MGRPSSITKIPTTDSSLDRLQDHLVQTLNPVLKNPGLSMANWRFNEGPYPTANDPVNLLLQYRTPGSNSWTTVAAFDVNGFLLQPSWIAPPLLNSYTNFGGTTNPVGYYKDTNGRVWIRGFVNSGALGNAVFQLPVGYRPAHDQNLPALASDAFAKVVVFGSGNVTCVVGSVASYLSLDGLSFDTR